LPPGYRFLAAAGIALDSKEMLVFYRSEHSVIARIKAKASSREQMHGPMRVYGLTIAHNDEVRVPHA
jgi:hypothetical protein